MSDDRTMRLFIRGAAVRNARAAAVLILTVSCSKSTPPSASTATTAPAASPSASAAQVGTVAGKSSPNAIVILQPATPGEFPPDATAAMDQVSLTFTPALLFVRTGERVEFRNSDDTLHNVHVGNAETREPSFNVAIPTGESYSYTFQSDGFYHVTCDIHPAMSADIISSSTPFATMADGEGSFGFADVPPGDYVLREYMGKSKKQTTVQIKAGINRLAAGAAETSGENGR